MNIIIIKCIKKYSFYLKEGLIMTTLKTITTAQNRLCYFLTESTRDDGSVSYGVRVTTTLFGSSEEASVEDITSDKQFAERFVDLLADNLVLPSTLSEVAEEFVASLFTV